MVSWQSELACRWAKEQIQWLKDCRVSMRKGDVGGATGRCSHTLRIVPMNQRGALWRSGDDCRDCSAMLVCNWSWKQVVDLYAVQYFLGLVANAKFLFIFLTDVISLFITHPCMPCPRRHEALNAYSRQLPPQPQMEEACQDNASKLPGTEREAWESRKQRSSPYFLWVRPKGMEEWEGGRARPYFNARWNISFGFWLKVPIF